MILGLWMINSMRLNILQLPRNLAQAHKHEPFVQSSASENKIEILDDPIKPHSHFN
jgi:hypothetical protein